MKYVLLAIMMIISAPVLAVSVCTKDSVVTVVLDPTISGTSYTHNNSTGVWKTVFSYGNVSGISTCVPDAPSGSMGSITTKETGGYLDAVGGATTGQYCWCKMTHPMSSLWAFGTDNGSAADCASRCTAYCGGDVQLNAALRSGLFGSVAAANAAY